MNNDNSSGSDGLTVNFFKMFWKQIGHFVVRAINYGFNNGCRSITQNRVLLHVYQKIIHQNNLKTMETDFIIKHSLQVSIWQYCKQIKTSIEHINF